MMPAQKYNTTKQECEARQSESIKPAKFPFWAVKQKIRVITAIRLNHRHKKAIYHTAGVLNRPEIAPPPSSNIGIGHVKRRKRQYATLRCTQTQAAYTSATRKTRLLKVGVRAVAVVKVIGARRCVEFFTEFVGSIVKEAVFATWPLQLVPATINAAVTSLGDFVPNFFHKGLIRSNNILLRANFVHFSRNSSA